MARFPWLATLRLAVLASLAGSSALVVDYLSPVASYCGANSGCGQVRQHALSHLGSLFVPLPAVGLMAFTAVYTLSLLPGERRRLAAIAAIVGGVGGAALLLVQKLAIGVFCSLCTVVNVGAVIAGIAGALYLASLDEGPAPEPLRDWAFMALGALAVSAPLAWPQLRPAPDLPPGVAAYYEPGKINVVEFVDFECPFCRLLHPKLKAVVREYGDRVNFVRLDLPLAMHPRARAAAHAHACATERGKGDAMADALFTTEDLSTAGLLRAGESVGLDRSYVQRCLGAKRTEEAVVGTERILRDSGRLEGLPTTFVGTAMLVGTQEEATLRDAFDRAEQGTQGGVPGPVFVAAVVIAALLVMWFGRARGAMEPPRVTAP